MKAPPPGAMWGSSSASAALRSVGRAAGLVVGSDDSDDEAPSTGDAAKRFKQDVKGLRGGSRSLLEVLQKLERELDRIGQAEASSRRVQPVSYVSRLEGDLQRTYCSPLLEMLSTPAQGI